MHKQSDALCVEIGSTVRIVWYVAGGKFPLDQFGGALWLAEAATKQRTKELNK